MKWHETACRLVSTSQPKTPQKISTSLSDGSDNKRDSETATLFDLPLFTPGAGMLGDNGTLKKKTQSSTLHCKMRAGATHLWIGMVEDAGETLYGKRKTKKKKQRERRGKRRRNKARVRPQLPT